MSPQNSPQQTPGSNDTTEDKTAIQPTAAAPLPAIATVKKSPQQEARQTALTFVKSGLFVGLAIIVFHWGNTNYKIGDRLSKVNTEVWIGIVVTVATTYWQWYSEREKDRVKAAQANAAVNSATIKAVSEAFEALVKRLENRIDSVLLQIAQVKQDQAENNQAVDALQDNDRNLTRMITDARQEYLEERLEIVRAFYGEICQLNASVSYLRGYKEGDRPLSTEKLNEILSLVAERANKELEASRATDEPK